nr:hypothetical protein [Cognatishimia sp. MH4019]
MCGDPPAPAILGEPQVHLRDMAGIRTGHHGGCSRKSRRIRINAGHVVIIFRWQRFVAVACQNDIDIRQGCDLMRAVLGPGGLWAGRGSRMCQGDNQIGTFRAQLSGRTHGRINHIFDGYASQQFVAVPFEDLRRQDAQKPDLERMFVTRCVAQGPLQQNCGGEKRCAICVGHIGLNNRAGECAVKSGRGLKPEIEIMIAKRYRIISQGRDCFAGRMLVWRVLREKRGHWCALQQIARIQKQGCAFTTRRVDHRDGAS